MILVRHAHAGNKSNWTRDDGLRPLTARGLAQSMSLVKALTEDDVGVVWSSPAVRCRQTMAPLAVDRGIEVRDHELLAKDASVDALLEWLLAHQGDPWALCTHGEVFSALLDVARESGLIAAPSRATEKGAAWRVRPRGDGSADLQYVPPLLLG